MARQRTMYDLQPGYPVFTVDGGELGRVRDVRDGAFQVDAPWRPDYWLPVRMVLSVIPGERVTVDARLDDIEQYQMDRPDMGPDEYQERYWRNYRAGLDFDPERNPRYRNYGGTASYPDEGGSRERGDDYERNPGRRDYYPQGDYQRQGQWESQRQRERFTGDEPMQSRYGPGQWGEQYRGYQGQKRHEDDPYWYEGRPTWTGGYRQGGYQGGQDSGYPRQERGMSQERRYTGGSRRYSEGQFEEGTYEGGGSERRSYRGVGPKGYQRGDDRIKEDVCEALARHHELDPSDIEVTVENGEVTLKGLVETRHDKHVAEDVAAEVSGVRDVHNRLKAQTSIMEGVDKKVVGW